MPTMRVSMQRLVLVIGLLGSLSLVQAEPRCLGNSPTCSLGFKTILHRLTPSGCEEICVLDPSTEPEFECGYCNDELSVDGSNGYNSTDDTDNTDDTVESALESNSTITPSVSPTPNSTVAATTRPTTSPTPGDFAIPLPTLPVAPVTAFVPPTWAPVVATTSGPTTAPPVVVTVAPSVSPTTLLPTQRPVVAQSNQSSSSFPSTAAPVANDTFSPTTLSPVTPSPVTLSPTIPSPVTPSPVANSTAGPTVTLTVAPVVTATNETNAPSTATPTVTPVATPTTVEHTTLSPIVATSAPIAAIPPTSSPALPPTGTDPGAVTYVPGELTVQENGLLLSTGLSCKLIGTKDQPVMYDTGGQSTALFHRDADAGAVFVDTNPNNPGGWIYVNNAEVQPFGGTPTGQGGVGAMTFDATGQLLDYKMILQQTTSNCAGGRTPWHTWVSCEEYDEGQCWQVDPTGQRAAQPIRMTETGRGKFEAFAYDVRNVNAPHFYVTKDDAWGELRRYTPDMTAGTSLDWDTLHGSDGTLDYLVLTPDSTGNSGTYMWVSDRYTSAENAKAHYPNAEGIDVLNNQLFFVAKEIKSLFILDLDGDTYTKTTTAHGLLDGQPDQVQRIIGSNNGLLYFTEDGGQYAGVHARNTQGQFYTILESHEYTDDETTGLAFSPDGKVLYIAYQDHGLLFSVWRQDGQSFDAQALNVKFHAVS